MALRLKVKPGERVAIGGSFISIERTGNELSVQFDGNISVLKQKDILLRENCHSKGDLLFYSLQQMYLTNSVVSWQAEFFQAAADLIESDHSAAVSVAQIARLISVGDTFKALKQARQCFVR